MQHKKLPRAQESNVRSPGCRGKSLPVACRARIAPCCDEVNQGISQSMAVRSVSGSGDRPVPILVAQGISAHHRGKIARIGGGCIDIALQ